MRTAAPPRDRAPPALALVLALLALPGTGWLAARWLPVAPAAYQAVALVVVALAWLALGPARGAGRALRPAGLLLAASPFLVFGVLEGGRAALPGPGWIALGLCAVVLAGLRAGRSGAALGLAAVLGAGVVLAAAGAALLPAGWNPLLDPAAASTRVEVAARLPADDRAGVRLGAPLPVARGTQPALTEGRGPWWVEAGRADHPGPRPVVLVLGARAPEAPSWIAGGATVLSGLEHPFTHAHDLRPFDVVLAREHAWREDDPQARRKADAVAGFVRKGGLLIGPAPGRSWPPGLGRRLRAAGRSPQAGLGGVRRLGFGRVARAAHQADVEALFTADLWVREVGSVLLDPQARPPARFVGAVARRAHPSATAGVLLVVYVLALAALTRVLRGGLPQLLGTFLAAATVAAGLAWTSPADPGFRVHGVALDLGGAGGRRIEAVWIQAGADGYRGRVAWSGGGVVGLRGGLLAADGTVQLQPGQAAWVVREREGLGAVPAEAEARSAAALRPLLTGAVDPRRLRYGRLEALPVRVAGWGPVPAWSATLRPPKE